MKSNPCAKINLGLYITQRRPDGYHNLETVFYPIPLCDELEVQPAAADSLTLEGIPVAGPAEDNLVMRVVGMLRSGGFPIPPLSIRLTKHIPSGAGLGGGSSDAAFMLKMLNEMFRLGLSETEMEQRIAPLGADCAFFVRCHPVLATGIGNIFSPLPLSLRGMHLLLVKPDDFVSTREAYAGVCPALPPTPLAQSIGLPISEWQANVRNDFEQSIFPQHPTIANIKSKMLDAGAAYAAMSGSGSSVFGLFPSAPTPLLLRSFSTHFVFSSPL